MKQRYNVIFPRHLESEIDEALQDIEFVIPDAVIVRRKNDYVEIDCPIWDEEVFVSTLEEMDCRFSKNRTYKLSAT